MLNLTPLAIVAAAANLLPSALATFDASANTNMAVYWGQGPSQKPLHFFCDDDNIDIIPIGFVNVFPDQSGGYPGTNFGNQCGSETYKNVNGSSSLLLSNCPGIGSDITYCQSKGKKILLSLGGAIPNNQHLKNGVTAVEFATFLWEAFGPEDVSKPTPRPFGNAVVDGFDFDIENVLASGEDAGDLDRGYGTMVNTLRTLYEIDKSKPYYISAAPQCIVPDAHLAAAIETSPFDFLFIQFYNTPQCSARAYFDHAYGGGHTNISFASWVDFVQHKSYNPNTKVYLGLPAAPDTNVVYDLEMYLQPNEANEIIKALQCEYKHEFGGVMIYEATSSQNNQIHGQPYADVLKGYLKNTECTVSPPVTSSATVHSSRPVSSTQAVTTTHAVSTTQAASSIIIASSSAVIPSSSAASSVGVPSSSSSVAVSSPTASPSGKTSASISTSGSSLPAVSSGSSTPISSGIAVVSVTQVSTVSRCPPNVSDCPFQSQTTVSTTSLGSASVLTPGKGPSSSSSVTAVTSSVPAPVQQGTTTTSVSLFISASGSTPFSSGASGSGPSSNGPSAISGGPTPSGAPTSGFYQNTTSASGASTPASVVTSSRPTPILSGTTISPVPESTEYTSLTTYTTVTSCPVTTTKVQGGTTSVIVKTSLITSTVTTCPHCSEKTKSVPVPGVASNTPGFPGEVGTTALASVPSNSASPSPSGKSESTPSVAPAGHSTGLVPSPTIYTTTEIVKTLTTICSEATTFSLSSSGRVYTATANETLTISECPCTLTHKTTGFSTPTDVGSPSQPPPPGVSQPNNSNASGFLTGTSHFGAPGISGAKNAPSKSEGESGSVSHAGLSSPSNESESSTEGSNGSSSAGSPGASNAGSQSKANGVNGGSSPSEGSPGVSNAGSQSSPDSKSGASPPGSENKVAAPQQSSPEQAKAQGSPSEEGPAGSASNTGTQALSSGVTGAHHAIVTMEVIPVPEKAGVQALKSSVTGAHLPVVTMQIIPVPESPSQIAQSGQASQNGQPSGQKGEQESGQKSGEQPGQGGQQNGQSGKASQQGGQQNGQNGQIGQQSGQQGTIAPLSGNNGTAPVYPSGTISASPSGTAPASQGGPTGSPAKPSPQEFQGAASRVGGSLFGVVIALAATVLL